MNLDGSDGWKVDSFIERLVADSQAVTLPRIFLYGAVFEARQEITQIRSGLRVSFKLGGGKPVGFSFFGRCWLRCGCKNPGDDQNEAERGKSAESSHSLESRAITMNACHANLTTSVTSAREEPFFSLAAR
jgi:hypothetical protein